MLSLGYPSYVDTVTYLGTSKDLQENPQFPKSNLDFQNRSWEIGSEILSVHHDNISKNSKIVLLDI